MATENKYAPRVQLHDTGLWEQARFSAQMWAGNVSKVWVLATLFACRSTAPLAPDEGFRRIQEQEAELDLGRAELARSADCASTRTVSEERVCAPSRAICKLAQELDDADARARCRAATDACEGARERTSSACATNAPAP